MSNVKLLGKYMQGNKVLYLGAIIAVGLATFFSIICPLVIRVTIDSIIGDKPIDAPDWIADIIMSLGSRETLIQKLWLMGLLLVVLTALRGLFLFWKGKWSAVASETIARNMREELFDHLQHLPYEYYVKAETGDLIQRCTSDVDTIRRFLAVQLVEMGRAIFMVIFVSAIMFSLDTKMALIAVAVVPVIFLFSYFYYREIKKSFKLADEAEGRMSTVLQENLTGIRVVRAFAREKYEIEKFAHKSKDYRDKTYRVIYLLAWYWSLSDFLSLFQIGLVLVLGSYWASQGRITLGTLVVFTTYEGMFLWPIRQMGRILTDLGKTLVSLDRIKEILAQPIEEEEPGEKRPPIMGNIEFKNVSFCYSKDRAILNDISFKVKAGETVAILGPTGSGKSSLVHLLIRLYDYQQGSIKIDGCELKEIARSWLRKKVGLVLQEPFLFARSIKDNIGLAKDNYTEREIISAANNAAIHKVIMDFENGYNTIVGERGVSLSGGQKQRIAMARMLIRDCPILIFDDSLSAVDTETDAAIRAALREMRKKATIIIISHRINTLAEADKILVLDEGSLVQAGTHEELIKQHGLYKRVWEIQNYIEVEKKGDSEVVR